MLALLDRLVTKQLALHLYRNSLPLAKGYVALRAQYFKMGCLRVDNYSLANISNFRKAWAVSEKVTQIMMARYDEDSPAVKAELSIVVRCFGGPLQMASFVEQIFGKDVKARNAVQQQMSVYKRLVEKQSLRTGIEADLRLNNFMQIFAGLRV